MGQEREKTTKESCQKWVRWYLAKQSREVVCRWTWHVWQKVTHCRCTFSVSKHWTQFFFSALCELPGADVQLEVVVLEQDGSHETAGVHGQITHANHTTT